MTFANSTARSHRFRQRLRAGLGRWVVEEDEDALCEWLVTGGVLSPRSVPVEKRDTFLQRIAAMLALRERGRFTDTDVADVAHLALCGLVQQAADSAA